MLLVVIAYMSLTKVFYWMLGRSI